MSPSIAGRTPSHKYAAWSGEDSSTHALAFSKDLSNLVSSAVNSLTEKEWEHGGAIDELATQAIHVFKQFYIRVGELLCPILYNILLGEEM